MVADPRAEPRKPQGHLRILPLPGRAKVCLARSGVVRLAPVSTGRQRLAVLNTAERFLLTARTEATDCMLIFSERHAGLGVCAWKAHGSFGLVHGVYKDRKCSFLYGV